MNAIWIAKKPCGCIVAFHLDMDGCEEDLGSWLRRGLTVEKIFADSVKFPQQCEKCREIAAA